MKWCMLLVMVCILNANPIVIEVINEFQVAPFDSERVELRYLQSSTLDTVFIDSYPLLNTQIGTPVGQASIDTNIFLVGIEQTVIGRSVLTGSFGLPDDSGFISIADFYDSVYYPGHANVWYHAPAPPVYWSAAKFHCYAYSLLLYEYYLISDWYIDSTPTFGAPNDDYPGCVISGSVYDGNNQPLPGARVTTIVAHCSVSTFPPVEFYTCCTTYTISDGSYHFDSLLPYYYFIDVYASGYLPDTQITGKLCCTDPLTDLDFYLQTGIEEHRESELLRGSFVQPNPFHTAFHITMAEPIKRIDIYDVTGKLMQRVDNENMRTNLSVDCADLPRGIYFIAFKEQKLKVIKF